MTIQLPPPPTSCLNRTATLTHMTYRPSISHVDALRRWFPSDLRDTCVNSSDGGNAGVIGMATLAFKNAECAYACAAVQERRLDVQLCLLLRRDRQAGTLVTATTSGCV